MKKKLPILIIVPHGGLRVPEELTEYVSLKEFDIFFQADTCANDIFEYKKNVTAKIGTHISRLLIDTDRPYKEMPLAGRSGVINKVTLDGKNVFKENTFPDEIAMANLLKRYYFPFHDAIKKVIEKDNIRLIIQCHTMMAAGPKFSADAGEPRPFILIENRTQAGDKVIKTCPDDMAESLNTMLRKELANEEGTVTDKCIHGKEPLKSYIMREYGTAVPLIRLSMSKALFMNEEYFSFEYLRVDEIRLAELRDRTWSAISRFYEKNF